MAIRSVPARQKGDPVYVFISPTVAKDYEECGLFPSLASRGGHSVPLDAPVANEVYESAKARIKQLSGVEGRGRKISYRKMLGAIERAFQIHHMAKFNVTGFRFGTVELDELSTEAADEAALPVGFLLKKLGIPIPQPEKKAA